MANFGSAFTNETTVTIPGATHGLGTKNLCVEVYNGATPAVRLQPGSVTVHPSSFEVVVTFAQLQSGYVVLNAGHPAPGLEGNYLAVFTGEMSVTIPGSTHALGTKNLCIAVYDTSVPRHVLTPGAVTVHPSSFDVVVTFAQNQSGVIVICGHTGAGGTANSATTFTSDTSITVSGATHGLGTARLLVEVYDTATPARRVTPGQVTVDPSTFDVVVTFAQAQSGTVVLNGSVHTWLVPVGQASAAEVSTTIAWSPQHRRVAPATSLALAQALGSVLTVVLAQGASSTTAQPLVLVKTVPCGQAATSTLAQTLAAALIRLVSAGGTVATGQALAWAPLTRLVEVLATTDLAQGLTWQPQHRLVTQAVSSELGQALSLLKTVSPTHAVTTEAAPALVPLLVRLLLLATEQSLAIDVDAPGATLVFQSISAETVQAVAWAPLTRLLVLAMSTAQGQSLSLDPLTRLVTPASTVMMSQAVAWSPHARLVTQVLDAVLAESMIAPGAALVGPALLEELVPGVLWSPQHRLVLPAFQLEDAQGISAPPIRLLLSALMTDTSEGVTWNPLTRLLLHGSETATALEVLWHPLTRLVGSTGEDAMALLLGGGKIVSVAQSVESTVAAILTSLRLIPAGQATDTAAGLSVTWAPQARLAGLVTAVDVAMMVTTSAGVLYGGIFGTWTMEPALTGTWTMDNDL